METALISTADLTGASPQQMTGARANAHRAVQLLAKAASANLDLRPDDSQSNLGWDPVGKQFLSQPVEGSYFARLILSPLTVGFGQGTGDTPTLDLDNVAPADAEAWLDRQLHQAGLKPASTVDLPYELPLDVAGINNFTASENVPGLAALSNWFDLAHETISGLAADNANLSPGPSPVRCWPHHFDIATYVSLETGGAETARGIGIGMSPGDESSDHPYFYVNPWPHLDPTTLPEPPVPGYWHTDGYVGLVAPAEGILQLSVIVEDLTVFLNNAFDLGRGQLGL
jgi:hypothetical protein